jgi:hypothetical protein
MTGQAQKYCESIACLRKRWETAKNDTTIDARNALDALTEEFSKRFKRHVIHLIVTSYGVEVLAERLINPDGSRKVTDLTDPYILRRVDWPEVAAIVDAGRMIREVHGNSFRAITMKFHDGWRIPE